MNSQTITVNGINISIPDYYQQVDSMEGDPENSIPFMVRTPNATCFAMLMPISIEQAMSRDAQAVIDAVRGFLADNQGIIKVEAGVDYVYTIVKNLLEPTGVQYILTYQIFKGDKVINIAGYFEESGTTGIRDSMVYAMLRNEGKVEDGDNPFAGWSSDPYDPTYKKGALMNLSEAEELDDQFQGFPLSMCREFIKALIQ